MNSNFEQLRKFHDFVSNNRSAALDIDEAGTLICRYTRASGVDGMGPPPMTFPSCRRIVTCIRGEVTTP